MSEVTLKVSGMGCSGCVDAVTRAVKAIAPAADVSIDLAGGTVAVRNGPGREAVAAAIEKAGYDIKG
jgi:copper chaperone